MNEHISIIGAGIGGLTTALILKQKGYQVTIYESASEIKPVGAGIVMANNAMQVFKKMGLHHKVEHAGNKISSMSITNEKLNPISVIELSMFEEKYGVHNVAIHRGELQKILAEEIGFENIRLSKRLSKIEQKESLTLTFEDNTVENCAIVIGADGIKSTVRKQLFKTSEIRNTKQICWRGIYEAEPDEKYRHNAIEAWGKGKRFGFTKISDKKTYWYAVASEGLIKQDDLKLCDLFRAFHPDVLRIISGTPEDTIITGRLEDLKPIKKWHNKNVCLIGDAAHATTPNMGQGACQAIEDAYTIGQLLDPGRPMGEVFAGYERLRLKKAHSIVKTSWRIGKAAHMKSNLGIWLRNTMMRSLPASANTRQLHRIFDIEYV